MFFIQLSELKSQGAPIPWSVILKHAPLTMKDELIEATAAEEKRLAEQQAQESKIAQQQAQVEMAKAQAQIQADLGRARERNSQTVENETNSALNRAKTVSEIQETNVKTAKAAAEALAIVKGPNGSTEQRTV
jgi:multidrug resistance efflux pump